MPPGFAAQGAFTTAALCCGFALIVSLADPRRAQAEAPAAATVSEPPAAAPAGARTFPIEEFRVTGNTVLPTRAIEAAVYPYLGPDRTAGDVERARAALDQLYMSSGYPTVSAEIPAQHDSTGVIILHVVERRVGRLRVTGSRYFLLSDIKAAAPSLAEGTVPHMPDVQSNVIALNQLPDRSVTPALRAGAAPDTVDVDLQVTDHLPFHGTLEVDNRRSVGTNPLRLAGSARYDNLFQRGDSVAASFQVAPQNTNDAEVYAASYLFNVPKSRLQVLASYLHSNSNVTSVGTTNVVGRGDDAGLRLLVALGSGDGFIHSLSLGGDYKHFTEDVTLAGNTLGAPVTYYPLTVSYQADWSGTGSTTGLIASLVFNPRGLGSTDAPSTGLDNKRYAANANFVIARADLAASRSLPYGIELYGHVAAQVTPDALISNEQLSLGGLDSVRGYLESEALGDTGGIGQLELRSPALGAEAYDRLNEARAFLFADGGVARIHHALPEQANHTHLSSTGAGVRVRVFDYLNAELINAVTLDRGPSVGPGTDRLLFRVFGVF